MKVMVAGAGKLGRQAAGILAAAGHAVTVVDRDGGALRKLVPGGQVRPVVGDACEPDVLEGAGALTSDLLIAAAGEDEDNLVIALLAKRQFAVPRVLARINDPDNAWMFDERWGVDVSLPAEDPLVALIEEATGATDTVGLLRLATAGVSLVETRLSTQDVAGGRTLADLVLPPGTVVATVVREGCPVVPAADHPLRAGDVLLIVTRAATTQDIAAAFHRAV